MKRHLLVTAALVGGVLVDARAEPARAPEALQNARGDEHTERVSRSLTIGQNGRVSVSNISGDIVVTVGNGDTVSIVAVKRTRGDRADLAGVSVIIEERSGRVTVETRYESAPRRPRGRAQVAVDYAITMPAGTSVDLRSVSGDARVIGVRGTVRAETISGDVVTSQSPRVELAKSVSGTVEIADADLDGELVVSNVSGDIRIRGVKARGAQLSTVSGAIDVTEISADRFEAKSVSGDVQFAGTLARNGRYALHSHSGNVRLSLGATVGVELVATSFSGEVSSNIPVTLGGRRSGPADRRGRGPGRRSVRAVYGDGGAVLDVHTFSGDIAINRQ